MYHLYKDDPGGNKIPYIVATRPFADVLVQDKDLRISRIVDVPRNASTLIKM